MSLKVRLARSISHFGDLADDWSDVVGRTCAGPFQSYAWASSWWAAYGADLQLTPALVYQDGSVCGLVPLALRSTPDGDDELIIIGTGMSDRLDWILAPELDEHAVLAQLLDAVDRAGVTAVDFLDLPGTSTLLNALRNTGLGGDVSIAHPCPSVELPPSAARYLAGRSRNLREAVRKAHRRAAARGVGPLVVHQSAASCRRAMADFIPLHLAWWRERGGHSVLRTEASRRFLERAVPLLADSGAAEVTGRYRGTELISAFLILRHGRVRYYYQAALHPGYADLAPGVGHMAAEIVRAIEDGMATFDLLRGDEPYKSRWSTGLSHTYRVRGQLR